MIKIRVEKNFEPALEILNQMQEFSGKFVLNQMEERLKKEAVILVAWFNNTPAGCKIGYTRFENNIHYSWLGGVLPKFRQKGIAQMLNDKM